MSAVLANHLEAGKTEGTKFWQMNKKVEYNFEVQHLGPTQYYVLHSFWHAKFWQTIVLLPNSTSSNIFCYTVWNL